MSQANPGCSSTACSNRKPIRRDRKSTRLNSSHLVISYAVFCLKKKKDLCPKRVYLDIAINLSALNAYVCLNKVCHSSSVSVLCTTFSVHGPTLSAHYPWHSHV